MNDTEPAPSVQDTLPVPNLPLLRKVLDHIDAHPDEWEQRQFAVTEAFRVRTYSAVAGCGTAYCIAGHVAVMMGADPDFSNRGTLASSAILPDGTRVHIPTFAREQLGLTESEAWPEDGSGLFDIANSRADVQRIAERIAARAGEVL